MKKNKLLLMAIIALMCNTAFAQSFFVPTTYRGAFAPAPAAMWTGTWVNWDPQNATYPAANVTVNSNITTNTTWTTGNTYLLNGQIYVTGGATLTIQPGVKVLGNKASVGAGLFITQGSKIHAVGTPTAPIVFTSNQAKGARDKGDWGGVILLGNASYNAAGGVGNIEGIAPSALTQFGGGATPNDNDNSGEMQYCRIEFGGYVYQPNKEINGLTFGAVGAGTTIDHIQVSFANDDAYEWFGGTVNCKYLVAYRNLDDDWDTDNGFSGHIQFCLSVRDPAIADNPSVSTSEGFESDNDAAGSTNSPQTKAMFSNITLIGPLRGGAFTTSTIAAGYRRGARIRRNSALKIYNSIFMDYARGIHIDGTLCEGNSGTGAGALKFMNNILVNIPTTTEVNSGSTFNITSWFNANNNSTVTANTGILTTPYNFTAPDYRPATGSPALSGAIFTDNSLAGLVLFPPTVPADTIWYCKLTTASALTATALAGNTLKWWGTYAAGGVNTGTTAPTPATTTAGVKTYYVSQVNPSGVESARKGIVVITKALVSTPLSITGTKIDLCYGTPYKYYVTVPAANATSYTWVMPTDASLVSTSPMGDTAWISFASPYLVANIGVYASNSCGNSVTRFAKVQAKPTTSGIISGTAVVCSIKGTATSANYTVVPAAGFSNYAWTLPAGATQVAGGTTNSIDVTFDNTYVTGVIMVATQGTCLTAATKTFKAYTKPATLPATTFVGSASVCVGSSAGYKIGAVNGATQYNWVVPAGAVILNGAGTDSVTVQFNTAVTGLVKAQPANACGGGAFKSMTVTAASCARVVNPTTTSATEMATVASATSLYPNPATSQFTINYTATANKEILVAVYDVLGRKVSDSKNAVVTGSNAITINCEKYAAGVYTVKVIDLSANSIQTLQLQMVK